MENEEIKGKYTQKDFEKLQAELLECQTTRRAEIIKAIAEAKSFGDLSENDEYSQAKKDQEQNEARIAELTELIKNAEVISENEIDISKVSLGTTVTVLNLDTNKETVYYIVSNNDVDPLQHKISESSPIGRTLCGKSVFDNVTVTIPAGSIRLQIRKIEHTH